MQRELPVCLPRSSADRLHVLPPPLPADDPAAKQQWVHALGWWCQDGERLRAVEAMYAAYCSAMRDRSILSYAEHAPAEQPAAAGAAAGPGALIEGSAGSSGGGSGGVSGEAGALALAMGVAVAGQPLGAQQQQQPQGAKKGWKGWGASKVQSPLRI